MAALAADERGAASRMLDAWSVAWEKIDKDLAALLDQIDKAAAAGEEISPAWLHKQRRLARLKADAEEHLRLYARTASLETQQLRAQAVAASQANAHELAAAAINGGRARTAQIVAGFDRLPANVLELLVGNLSPASPLAQLAASLPGDGASRLGQALIEGISRGRGPREIARNAKHALGGNLSRALTIARTEQLRVYRQATRMTYEQNQSIVVGWRWTAAKDLRTCSACWAMDGTEHTWTETLDGHPNCRCAMVPLTAAGETFGLGTGPEAFRQLDPAVQDRIVGASAGAAIRSGQISLRDLVGRSESEKWGTTRHVRRLSDAKKFGDKGAAFRLGVGL